VSCDESNSFKEKRNLLLKNYGNATILSRINPRSKYLLKEFKSPVSPRGRSANLSTYQHNFKAGTSVSSYDRNPMYFNPVGPGDHNLPIYSAAKSINVAERRNAPSYSIITRNDKIPYFPEFATDFMGKEAPGTGTYNPSIHLTKDKMPAISVPGSARF